MVRHSLEGRRGRRERPVSFEGMGRWGWHATRTAERWRTLWTMTRRAREWTTSKLRAIEASVVGVEEFLAEIIVLGLEIIVDEAGDVVVCAVVVGH